MSNYVIALHEPEYFVEEARRRGVTPTTLIRKLLIAIKKDNMVLAVLDDGDEIERMEQLKQRQLQRDYMPTAERKKLLLQRIDESSIGMVSVQELMGGQLTDNGNTKWGRAIRELLTNGVIVTQQLPSPTGYRNKTRTHYKRAPATADVATQTEQHVAVEHV